jgi:hypothetical protein
MADFTETRITYPTEWEEEYCTDGVVRLWVDRYPQLFKNALENHNGAFISGKERGTAKLFAQYALQYHLRDVEGADSVTWYKIAATSPSPQTKAWIGSCHSTMGEIMKDDFVKLQGAVRKAGFKGVAGEPDLFCWKGTDWFFAEAKMPNEGLLDSQKKWFGLCHSVLNRDVRVYRLYPEN